MDSQTVPVDILAELALTESLIAIEVEVCAQLAIDYLHANGHLTSGMEGPKQ